MRRRNIQNERLEDAIVIIVENGNGQSEIVGIWVVANETEETINSMVEIFKEQNPKWTNTKTVMTDKDFIEHDKDFIEQKCSEISQTPNCEYAYSMFFFLREVTAEKMRINKKQRDALLETIQKIAYSRSLTEYETHKQTLLNQNVPAFDSYFIRSWEPIKEEWVIGLSESTTLGNNTNNRVKKIKS